MYSMTVFKPPRWWEAKQRFVYDNKTHRRMDFDDWERLTSFLNKLSQRPLQEKTDAELISPAVFKPGEPRRNANVLAWAGWAAIDVDDHPVTGDVRDHVDSLFGAVRYCCYSTASSRHEQPRYRVLFSLSRHVEQQEIRPFWSALQSEYNEIGDKQCRDLSRMYYTPATFAQAYHFFFVGGSSVDVDVDYLLSKYPHSDTRNAKSFIDRLPDEWKQQVIQHRKDALNNTNVSWVSYADCPFVDQRQIEEYKNIASIDGTGRYRMIYKIMVVTAMNAVRNQYPISADQLVNLILQLDAETTKRYQNRPLDVEANNALDYAYRHAYLN